MVKEKGKPAKVVGRLTGRAVVLGGDALATAPAVGLAPAPNPVNRTVLEAVLKGAADEVRSVSVAGCTSS